jgi:hypothetical protein
MQERCENVAPSNREIAILDASKCSDANRPEKKVNHPRIYMITYICESCYT